MPETFQHEHVAAVPRGYKVRTVTRGDHEIRVAFPPGRRRRGAGHLVEILHPRGENPLCKIVNLINPTTLELKRAARERAKRIREARNPRGFSESEMSALTQLWHTARIAGQNTRHERLTWAAREWDKTHPGERLRAYKALDETTRGYGNPRNESSYEKTGGLHIKYSPVNQAYFLMWHGTVLRIFPTKAEAKQEMEYLLRKNNPGSAAGWVTAGAAFSAGFKDGKWGKRPHPEKSKDPNAYAKGYAFGKRTRGNPDDDELGQAEGLYEEFHGRAPREILEMQESSEQRGEYTALGGLVELTMIAPTGDHVQVKFKDDGVRVASSPNGEQLYLLGGNQDISGSLATLFGADDGKDLVDLGEAKQIVYEAAKWQTDFTPQEWKHDFGEESGVRPRAFFDQLKKRIFFAGGNYQVKRPGIVD